LSILPALGACVDYLWRKTPFTDGVVASGGGRGYVPGIAPPRVHRRWGRCNASGGSGATSLARTQPSPPPPEKRSPI